MKRDKLSNADLKYFEKNWWYSEYLDEDGVGPYPEHEEIWANFVAKDLQLPTKDVKVEWHGIVGEYCIWIQGKWSGYFNVEEYFRTLNID